MPFKWPAWDQQVLKLLLDPHFLPVNLPRQAKTVSESRINVTALRLHLSEELKSICKSCSKISKQLRSLCIHFFILPWGYALEKKEKKQHTNQSLPRKEHLGLLSQKMKRKKNPHNKSHSSAWRHIAYMALHLCVPCNFFPLTQTARHIIIQTKLFCDASDFTHAQWSFLLGAFKPVSPFLMLPGQHLNQSGARCLWRNSCCHYFLTSGRRRGRQHVCWMV